MKIYVPGKDQRFRYLEKFLADDGHVITDDAPDMVIANFPYSETLPAEANVVFCGPQKAPKDTFDIMKDEKYLADAAAMTAEGAVHAAMGKIPCMIKEVHCLVVGWGRIGRALCGLLHNMGAHVRVCTRRREAWPDIVSAGGEPALTDDIYTYIDAFDVIFSTPPALVLGKRELSRAKRSAVLIDLASPPYGIDLSVAAEEGVNAWREPALPGRYCPASAARAIYSALERMGIVNG